MPQGSEHARWEGGSGGATGAVPGCQWGAHLTLSSEVRSLGINFAIITVVSYRPGATTLWIMMDDHARGVISWVNGTLKSGRLT